MTNTIITNYAFKRDDVVLGSQPLGMIEKQSPQYQALGWEVVEVDSGLGEDERGLPSCPECGRLPCTSLNQYWDNEQTGDCRSVDLYWCADMHMWGNCS